MDEQDAGAVARQIIDSNSYMTLGTADESGLPWVSPVWYAPSKYREFFWVSNPDARHSRNLVARPQLSIVIFESRAPEGSERIPVSVEEEERDEAKAPALGNLGPESGLATGVAATRLPAQG